MERFQRLCSHIQIEFRLFIYFTLLLTLFRIAFIAIYNEQLVGTTASDIGLALWYGFRLSLKTVGFISLLGIIFAVIPNMISKKWPALRIRIWMYRIVAFVLTILFCLRIPYYFIFNSGFNIMILNGMNDDISAILSTAINEYNLIPRLVVAIVLAILFSLPISYLVKRKTKEWAHRSKKKIAISYVIIGIVFAVLALFFRFGGSFNYENSINWENAARLQSNLLNEAILDDCQALYRVKSIRERSTAARKITFSVDQLRDKIKAVGGNSQATTIDDAFKHTIHQAMLPTQPNSVYLILGESYGLWPYLPEQKDFGDYVVASGKALMNSPQSVHTDLMLANGDGTISGVNGYITGLPNVSIPSNYESLTYKETYNTGIGAVMKSLGYKTVFWYGGFGTWQNIKAYVLAQNFDEYHDASDINYQNGNAWGAPDKALFERIEEYMANHKGEKIFNFILTTSNHPPYNIDLKAEGFDESKVRGHLPPTIKETDKQVNEIGHMWYADHAVGQFVKNIESLDKTAIFAITGDHSERFNFDKEVDMRTRSAIPMILYGQGIQKNMMKEGQFGVAYQLIPTLAKLVGQPGQTYDAILPDLFSNNAFSFNHMLWIDSQGMHKQDNSMSQDKKEWMDNLRDIALWRLQRGNAIQ